MLYRFTITCPECGSDTKHITRAEPHLVESKAVAECTNPRCRLQMAVVVQIAAARRPYRAATPRPRPPAATIRHGSDAGYRAGCRLACCRIAHTLAARKRRTSGTSRPMTAAEAS